MVKQIVEGVLNSLLNTYSDCEICGTRYEGESHAPDHDVCQACAEDHFREIAHTTLCEECMRDE